MEFEYDLEIKKAIEKIKQENAKKVLLQLPDGLKPKAKEIKQALEKETDTEISIWLGSCFGACDFPKDIKKDYDLLIAWGHASWKY
jgi:2-(3-amino-3-carboxypropyl)histidine synthase